MSTLDVVAEVLREVAPRALSARQIVELDGGRLPTASKTPETVVSRDLALDVKKHGPSSRFLRTAPGEFMLKEALPSALFCDVDPFAAQWTRNLIAAGQIAPGVVDERSIRDLKPADIAGYRQFHAFSGIGIWSRALRDAGWPDDCPVFSGSPPCQPFSSAGRRRGVDDERHLWPAFFALINACRPPVVFIEQVASKDGRVWLDAVLANLEGSGYACRAFDIPACGIGAPHRRQRLYIVAVTDGERLERIRLQLLAGRSRATSFEAGRRGATFGASGGRTGDGSMADTVSHDRTGRIDEASGRAAFEPDRYSDAGSAVVNARLARGGRDAREVPGEEAAGEGQRLSVGDLAHEPVASGAAHNTFSLGDATMPRCSDREDAGADRSDEIACSEAIDRRTAWSIESERAGAVHFQPGDRVIIDGDPSWGGAVKGFWAEDVEWIFCRPEPGYPDGRWRPVGSGIKPLAARTARGMGRNRTARLKGYGNGIVKQAAQVFIEAVIDTLIGAPIDTLIDTSFGAPNTAPRSSTVEVV